MVCQCRIEERFREIQGWVLQLGSPFRSRSDWAKFWAEYRSHFRRFGDLFLRVRASWILPQIFQVAATAQSLFVRHEIV